MFIDIHTHSIPTIVSDILLYVCCIHGMCSCYCVYFVSVPPVLLTLRDESNASITGVVDGSISILCEYFGSPVPSVLWLKDSVPVNLSHPFISVNTIIEGFRISSTLMFTQLDFYSDGQYVCQGRNTLVNLQTTNSSDISVIVNRKATFILYVFALIVHVYEGVLK